jgi:pilus assembly protein CpaE
VGDLSFIVYGPSGDASAELAQLLEDTGHAQVIAKLENLEELSDLISVSNVDALLLDLRHAEIERVLELLESLPTPRPLLLIRGPADDPQLLLRAVRLGVREYFDSTPSPEEFRTRLLRIVSEHKPVERAPAPVIAVVGAKGGVGTTTVACQLAAALQQGAPSVLVDVNLTSGDVDLYLDMQPAYSLCDLKGDPEDLDSTYMRTLVTRHRSGVAVLPAPRRIEEAELVPLANVRRAIDLLSRDFGWVIVDVPRSWDEVTLRTLDRADQILLVTARQVAALHHTRRQLELCQALGLADRVRLIVNRSASNDPVSEADMEKFLKRGADAEIPNAYESACLAADEGKTVGEIDEKGALARAYLELARDVHGWNDVSLPAGLAPRVRGGFLKWKK